MPGLFIGERDIMSRVSFYRHSKSFIAELAAYLKSQGRVLEVFSGNGHLAAELSQEGVDIVATTLFSGHDGHQSGMNFAVNEMDAERAVRKLGPDAKVLLMSWPVVSDAALRAIRAWGPDRPVVYIGETPRPELPGLSGLPGCASDEFFEAVRWERDFTTYQGNMLERAGVLYLDNPVKDD